MGRRFEIRWSRGRRCFALALFLLAAIGTNSSAGAASTTYLRPNGDVATSSPWTVVGAAKAWEALDDSVNPSSTPSSSDVISNSSGYYRTTEVAMGSTAISGLTVHGATGWFYSGTAGQVEAQVRRGTTVLGGGTFSSKGWHSFNVVLDGTQAQLDAITMRFFSSTTGLKEVSASFLTLETITAP